MELTDAAIRKLKPRPERREFPDAKASGLYLIIQPTGAKSFALRFRRPDGKSAGPVEFSKVEPTDEPVLGAPLTLAMARQLAASIQRERKRGVDVVAEHKATKERKRSDHEERAANTFGAAVRKFCDDHKPDRDHRLRHWRYTARVLGLDYPLNGGAPAIVQGSLAEKWGDKPLADIDDHAVHVEVKEARDRGIPGMGRRNKHKSEARGRAMHSALSLLFKWAVNERFDRNVKTNPCKLVTRPGQAPSRDRVLSEAEIRLFWRACDALGKPFGALLKLLLITGCRREEVRGMCRSELSEDLATWTLPSSRTKNWREHVVPLPPLARDLIGDVPRVAGDFVFTADGVKPVAGFTWLKTRVDALMLKLARQEAEAAGRDPNAVSTPAWRIHDLRRSCATGMAQIGIQPHVVEAVLNHVSGAKAGVAGIYNQYSYLPEKTAALERWAQHVEALVAGKPTGNVLNLPVRENA